ncbi:NUDIX domain-containing protein [Deinococcus aetherius]|nr:NUDIX domain-containing protein [Deinococcus aetherius]
MPAPETVTPASASTPRVGVGVLILNDAGEVLLTLRRRAPEAGCWSIAGGKVEFMETLEETAVREAHEETGLHVELVRLLCVTDHLVPAEGQHWVAPAYLACIVGGQLSNPEPEKTEEVRFFSPGALPGNLTLTAQNALAALRREGGA